MLTTLLITHYEILAFWHLEVVHRTRCIAVLEVTFIVFLVIYIDLTIIDSYLIAGETNYALYQELILAILILQLRLKDDDVTALWLLAPE